MPIFSKQKIYAEISLIIIFIAALAFFGIYPLFKNIKIISAEIQENQAIFLSFSQQGSYVMGLQKKYNEIEKEIPVISENFLTSGKRVDFFKFLEGAAADTSSSLKINVLNSKTELGAQDFISFQLVIENEFQGMMDFLAHLENADYYIDVISMNIKAAGPKSRNLLGEDIKQKKIQGEKITAVFEIRVYVKE